METVSFINTRKFNRWMNARLTWYVIRQRFIDFFQKN